MSKTLLALLMIFTIIIGSSILVYGGWWKIQVGDTSGSEHATTANLDYNELVTMPRSTVYAELYCYGSLIDYGNWTGVRLGIVLEKAGLLPQAGAVIIFDAADGYSILLSSVLATREDVIIAYEKDGNTITETMRLIVPGENGDKWISKITQIRIANP